MTCNRLYKLKDDLHVNAYLKLDFNVLTMVNERLQGLIINARMVNATCTE